MNSIYDVEYASLCEIGFKCATSVRNRVAIRKIGYDCVITPADPEGFIKAVKQIKFPNSIYV